MRIAAALFALLAGACCTGLPAMPAKTTALPPIRAAASDVAVTRDVWRDEKRNRDVPVTIYAPQHATARLPVVVFSHGIGESRDSYAWIGRTLAQHGYLTVHVTHAGTDRAVLERGYRHLYRAVKEPQNWINRPLDVSFVLDRLAARSDADVNQTAAVGHSAGAFTAFALAGMRTVNGGNFRDTRVKVAIPMSMPRLDGVVPPGGYDAIEVPLLNLTGTRDSSIIYRTFPRHRRIPFEETHAARQYLVTLQGATHNSFVLEDKRRDAILHLTVAFLDAYLRDDRAARAWFDEEGRAQLDGVGISVERKLGAAR
jgi:predicted dienelactone hydrolase